jgi:hypothetical protein
MNVKQLSALIEGIAPVVREYVDIAVAKEVAAVRQDVAERSERAMSSVERVADTLVKASEAPKTPDHMGEIKALIEGMANKPEPVQTEAPDHFDAIKSLIESMAERHEKTVEMFSKDIASLKERAVPQDDDYESVLAELALRLESEPVCV